MYKYCSSSDCFYFDRSENGAKCGFWFFVKFRNMLASFREHYVVPLQYVRGFPRTLCHTPAICPRVSANTMSYPCNMSAGFREHYVIPLQYVRRFPRALCHTPAICPRVSANTMSYPCNMILHLWDDYVIPLQYVCRFLFISTTHNQSAFSPN